MWSAASLGGNVWGCGGWRRACPGLVDAAGGYDSAGVIRRMPKARFAVFAVAGQIERRVKWQLLPANVRNFGLNDIYRVSGTSECFPNGLSMLIAVLVWANNNPLNG